MEPDYYKILGIDRSASKQEITRAYRKLAARYHPDKHQGNPLAELAEEKFKEINEAYHALVGDEHFFMTTKKSHSHRKKPKKTGASDISQNAKDSLYRGISCYNEGKIKQAIRYFEDAAEHSVNSNLYNLLGLAYCEMGEYRKALSPLIKATELDSQNGKYFYDAGYAFYQLKLWDMAIQYLLEAYNLTEEAKRLSSICVYISICNFNIGKTARAEFFLEEAVNYDPENQSYRILLDELRISQENGSFPKGKIFTKFNRFSFASRLEDSLGNLFRTIFNK